MGQKFSVSLATMKVQIALSAFVLSLNLAASIPFEKHLGDHHFKHGCPEHHKFDKYHHNGHFPPHHGRGVAEAHACSSASSSAGVHNHYPEHLNHLKDRQWPHPHPIHGHHPVPHYPHHNPGHVVNPTLHYPHHPGHVVNPHHINHHGFRHPWPEHCSLPHHVLAHENVEIHENYDHVYPHTVERIHPSFVVPEFEEITVVEEEFEAPVREITVFEREPVIEEKIEIPFAETITILIETDGRCDRPLRYADEEIIEEQYRGPIAERVTVVENERPAHLHPHRVVEERFEGPVNERLTVIERGAIHERPSYCEEEFRAPLADSFTVVERERFERPAAYEIDVEETYFQPGSIVRGREEEITTVY